MNVPAGTRVESQRLKFRDLLLLSRMPRYALAIVTFTIAIPFVALPLDVLAQGTPPAAAPAVSPGITAAVSRARAMADAGDGTKARDLLDSLVNALPRESFGAAEALYWRALMSEEAAPAELDWKRIVVEVPFSPRASSALLRLAELGLLRNNPKMARQHVQQLLVDHAEAPERPRALLILARSYFEERDAPRACGALTAVRKDAPLSAVEVRLQADELQQQCRSVREIALGATPDSAQAVPVTATLAAQTAALPPATIPVASPRTPATALPGKTDSAARGNVAGDSAARDSAMRNGTNATAPVRTPPGSANTAGALNSTGSANNAGSTRWTVQVAAYDTRAQAQTLVKKLSARKIVAHTAGTRKPFRVHIGRYDTRAEATAALAALKKKGQKGFVAEVPSP